MSTRRYEVDEDEIDLKEIFRTLNHYKNSIITITILFTLFAAVYAYFKPNIYSATVTVEVGMESAYGGYAGQDILSKATSPGYITSDTEMEIIKSRFLSTQALQSVDFSHRYYTTVRLREIELYKSSPFDINLTEGYNLSFMVYPYSEEKYRIKVKGIDENTKKEWEENKIYSFGEQAASEHYAFTLTPKKDKVLGNDNYRFVVLDKESTVASAQGGVSVSLAGKFSSILAINYSDNVPLRAQEFANALADAYIAQSVYKKTREASKTLSFIDVQLKQISENLRNSEIKLENFKKETSTISLDAKAQSVMEMLGDAERRLAMISIEVGLLNTLYTQVKTGKNLETLSVSGLTGGGGSGSGAEALTGMITDLQQAVMKVKILRADYTEQYPEVLKLRRQIKQMKKIIIDMIGNIKKNFDEHKKLLEASITDQKKLMEKLPEDERVYGGLQRKFVVNEKIYSYLLEKQAGTAIAKASTVSKNRVLDSALYPGGPIKPKRKMIVLVGLILGLILGIALAFLRDFLDDTIKSDEDIKRGTDAAQLGIIPSFRKEGETLKVFESPKSAAAEAFRNIRTNLQFMAPEKGAQVISVTSTVGGEGKTSICANLAGIISLTKKKVIILNLDMRKPLLHKRFNLKNNVGMSTLLSGHNTLPETIQHTAYDNLDIISSGPVPPNPSELIQDDRMEEILEMLKKVYNVIILDTPPVGLITDAQTLMRLSDATIYVLRASESKKGFFQHIEKLSKNKYIRGFSVVLNDVDMKKYGHSYGYGYGYYEDDV